MVKHTPTPLMERILARVCIDDATFCWIWHGAVTKHGYGRVTLGRRSEGTVLVHRAVYECMVGPIPDGEELDHRCRVPACCNPDHLEPVTHGENISRGRARRIVCPSGHYILGDNVYLDTRRPGYPQRRCRACNIESARRSEAARKAPNDVG